MRSNVEELSSVQKKITVTIPEENVNKAFNDAYKRFQKKSRLKGFRVGKAPLYLIKSSYGPQISYEVSDALLDYSLRTVLQEHKLAPVSKPQVTDFSEPTFGKDFSFSATIEVFPTIDLGEKYKGLEGSYTVTHFKQDDLENELNVTRRRYIEIEALEKADACIEEKNHYVTFSFSAFFEDKKIPRLSSSSTDVAMGFSEIPKEIEAALVGMKKGETKEIETVLSEDPEFSEKKLKISLSVEDIFAFRLPELDAEFAQGLGYESVEAFRSSLQKDIQKRIESSNRTNKETALLEKLSEFVSFEIPPAIITQVVDGMIKDTYGKFKGVNTLLQDPKLREYLAPEAEKRAKNTLLLWEVAKAEKIDVSSDEIKDYIKKSIDGEAEESLIQDIFMDSKERVKETMIFEKVIEILASSANLKEEVQ